MQKSKTQSKVADFGEEVGMLENEDDEFISPQNINTYREEINNIYDTLCEDVNNYQFENLGKQRSFHIYLDEYPNYDLKSIDLDRSDIPSLKPLLINYFKFCLSRSNYYELNDNLISESPLDPVEAAKSGIKFLNISNCTLTSLALIPFNQSLTILILSYNKLNAITHLDSL